MKKLLVLFVILMSFKGFSQKFELTPKGFVDSEDHTKNYLVLEFPNKTKEELFKETMIYLTKNYVSAKDVISKVDNEVITINAYSSIPVTVGFQKYTNRYTISFSFKDSKVKVDSPTVDLTYISNGNLYKLHISSEKTNIFNDRIYGKNNKLNYKRPKEDLELFTSQFILSYKLAMSDEKNEDW